MAKKKTPAQLKKKLWELCKQITRRRYIRPDGLFNCYTCSRVIDSPDKAHTGHFVPSGACGIYLRYDLRNLRVQDYYCNINLGGNGAEFYKRMVEEVGQEEVDQVFRDKNKIIKGDSVFLQNKIDEYEEILSA